MTGTDQSPMTARYARAAPTTTGSHRPMKRLSQPGRKPHYRPTLGFPSAVDALPHTRSLPIYL